MEFCGGHTHSILRYGLDEVLSPEIEFLHGPGCPVCVLSVESIEYALKLAKLENTIFITYGDLLRVPNPSGISLQTLRGEGRNIKIISSAMEALDIAIHNPDKLVIFFAFGFETTAPATAFLLRQAKALGLKNLKVISNHLLTPSILEFLFTKNGRYVDGVVGPGHVSAVIGANSYEKIAKTFEIPIVIAGFEPTDILEALIMLVERIRVGQAEVGLAYRRAATFEGNTKAKSLLEEAFVVRDSFPWRGLGTVLRSGLAISKSYEEFDGERIWERPQVSEQIHGCICGKILQGKAKPLDCPLFRKRCSPQTPIGPCMVSSEGACISYYRFKLV